MSSLPGSQPMATADHALPASPALVRKPLPRCSGFCRAAARWPESLYRELAVRCRRLNRLPPKKFGAREVLRNAVGQFAGRAGPCVTFLRTICFSVLSLALARSMANCAIFSPSSVLVLSHSENASCAALSTKPAACREDRRSLVCPKLRIGHLQREYKRHPVPHIFRRKLPRAAADCENRKTHVARR